MKQKYKITIKYIQGEKRLNKLVRSFGLGMEGVGLKEEISFTTTSKPTKKMIKGYENAIKQSYSAKDREVSDIEVSFEIL